MASSTSPSSTISTSSSSGGNSEEDLQLKMDERKQKRMLSNRESARRSRMRKQKHLDDLMSQVNLLRSENSHILSRLHVTTQQYLGLETENSALKAQIFELNSRLQALTEMLSIIQGSGSQLQSMDYSVSSYHGGPAGLIDQYDDPLLKPWDLPCINQPITASACADIFQY